MKQRTNGYGANNMVGRHVERLRKKKGISQKDMIAQMQAMGCDIDPSSYSKLEGQIRKATDVEVYTIAKILNVTIEQLFTDM